MLLMKLWLRRRAAKVALKVSCECGAGYEITCGDLADQITKSEDGGPQTSLPIPKYCTCSSPKLLTFTAGEGLR